MDELFEEKSQKIKIYMARERVLDPYEKNTELVKLNSISIPAIVTDLGFSQISWKMPGIETDKAKEIIIRERDKSLLEQSSVIETSKDEFYNGWKINGKLQFRTEDNYIRAYIYYKKI